MTLAIVLSIFDSGAADFSGPFCIRMTKALAHFGWQGCVISALYYFVDLGLRKQTANTRYIAGLAAMVLLAICPPVTFALLSSENSTRITTFKNLRQPLSSQNQFSPDEMKSLPLPNPQEREIQSHAPQIEPFMRQDAIRKWTGSVVSNQLIECVSPYVMTVYLMVSLALLCRVGVGYSVGRNLKADSIEIVNDRLQQFVERLCEQWAMSVVPVVASCQQVAAPVVFGVLRPIILLPPCFVTGCNVEQLEALLAHELAHIRRWDLLANLAQRVVEALLFFHPAVWYVSRRISIEREHACDDLVISTGWRPLDYCRALIGLAEACAMPRQPLVVGPISISAFGRGPSDFRQRILRLAGESATTETQWTRTGFSGLASVVCMLILVSIVLSSLSGSKPETPNVSVFAQPEVIVEEKLQIKEVESDAAGESGIVLNDPLVDVIIKGNSTIPNSEIAKHIKTRPGRPVTQEQIKDDVDALVRTRWFATVEPTLYRTDEGDLLAYHLLERPIVRRVEYKGLKFIKQKVFDAMTQLKPGCPFDVSSNRECAKRIEEHYREKGFPFATVELEKGNDRNDREVVFSIKEGPKVRVSGITYGVSIPFGPAIINVNGKGPKARISGITYGLGIPFGPAIVNANKKLVSKTQIVTLHSANSSRQQFANDTEQLKRYYHRLGYFDVDIKRELNTPAGQSKSEIRYEINEGIRYKIRHVEFIGNRIVPESEIRNVLKWTDRMFYNATEIARDVDAMKSVFDNRGHLLAHIEPLVRWSEERGLIDLVYRISPCIEAESSVLIEYYGAGDSDFLQINE